MPVRFQADNDLRDAIRLGVWRREPAIDSQGAHAAGFHGVGDAAVLAMAMQQNRVLISHDTNSMPAHFQDFIAAGNQSPGLLLAGQDAPVGRVVESIVLIWLASEPGEWVNRVTWLQL